MFKKHSAYNEESRSTLNTPCSEEGESKNGARVRKKLRAMLWVKKPKVWGHPRNQLQKLTVAPVLQENSPAVRDRTKTVRAASKRKRASANVASLKKPFRFMANFPSPPSLVIGSDGDLSPAYSLNSLRSNQLPASFSPGVEMAARSFSCSSPSKPQIQESLCYPVNWCFELGGKCLKTVTSTDSRCFVFNANVSGLLLCSTHRPHIAQAALGLGNIRRYL